MLYEIDSPRTGGQYALDFIAANQMPVDAAFRARLTTWLIDQRRAGEQAPLVDSLALAIVASRPPLRLSQRLERFFLYLSARRFRPGNTVYTSIGQGHPSELPVIMAWIEAEHHEDAVGFINYLESTSLITARAMDAYQLTPTGFERLEQAELVSPATRQAFVAMWFGAEMNQAYERGFEPAIRASGFEALRIDRKEHTNKIDDEIVMEIRRSRFVVADFTCALLPDQDGKRRADARGGVYYEAGFAQGLNIPVIWTVRNDLIEHVHFDTRQFAHITWSDPEDLRARLQNRIGAVITSRA
jgi:nucleoside 2-deoxyribosyltransferase